MLRPLGAEVRRLRLEKDLSQERVAEQAGCSYKYLGRIEKATVSAGALKLIRLARALGVTVGQLFETTTPGDTPTRERLQPPRKRATRRPSY
jgi:transcriptional regulator with XRE-family HTH domain